jgi:hypothetical protein
MEEGATVEAAIQDVEDGVQIRLTGREALSAFEPSRVQAWVVDRLVCGEAHRCFQPEQTVSERLGCVSTLAERRLATIGRAAVPPDELRAEVNTTEDGLEIKLLGRRARLAMERIDGQIMAQRVKEILACKGANRCGATDQQLVERFRCVSTLGERRFAQA